MPSKRARKEAKALTWRPWNKWTPRVLTILFAVLLFLFSFDVWTEEGSFWFKLVGFLIHNIPVMLLIGTLILAWHRPKWGAIIFLLLGLGFTIFFHTYEDGIVFLIISLPVFLVGGLFLVDWRTTTLK